MKFIAKFQDGTEYHQNPQDISVTNPSRNCFFDVLEQERANNHPIQFELINEKGSYSVDLVNGHFKINGTPILLTSKPVSNLKLVYYKTRCVGFGVGFNVINDEVESYTLGWQKRGTSEEPKTITVK
jgi:hypothetical protein